MLLAEAPARRRSLVIEMASPIAGCAVVAEHRLRRIDVAAPDRGDVAQAEEAAVDAEVDGLQALLRGELARHADGDASRASASTRAARRDRVLRLQRLHQRDDVEAERGDLLGRELEVDLLVLHAEQVDLGDVGHAQQLGAHALGIVAQLAVA